MRDKCDGCPCLEINDGRLFCFWYQSWCDKNNGCGNSFEKKPTYSQAETEEHCGLECEEHERKAERIVRRLKNKFPSIWADLTDKDLMDEICLELVMLEHENDDVPWIYSEKK